MAEVCLRRGGCPPSSEEEEHAGRRPASRPKGERGERGREEREKSRIRHRVAVFHVCHVNMLFRKRVLEFSGDLRTHPQRERAGVKCAFGARVRGTRSDPEIETLVTRAKPQGHTCASRGRAAAAAGGGGGGGGAPTHIFKSQARPATAGAFVALDGLMGGVGVEVVHLALGLGRRRAVADRQKSRLVQSGAGHSPVEGQALDLLGRGRRCSNNSPQLEPGPSGVQVRPQGVEVHHAEVLRAAGSHASGPCVNTTWPPSAQQVGREAGRRCARGRCTVGAVGVCGRCRDGVLTCMACCSDCLRYGRYWLIDPLSLTAPETPWERQ